MPTEDTVGMTAGEGWKGGCDDYFSMSVWKECGGRVRFRKREWRAIVVVRWSEVRFAVMMMRLPSGRRNAMTGTPCVWSLL